MNDWKMYYSIVMYCYLFWGNLNWNTMCDYCAALTHTDTNKQTTPRPADKKHNASPHKARRSKSNIGLTEEMEENTMAGGE